MLITLPRLTRSVHGELMANIETDFRHVATYPGTLGDGALYVYYRPHAGKR
jgi:hypothetical protein